MGCTLHKIVVIFLAAIALQACKHPLSIDGRGDIVDLKGSGRGCALEQYLLKDKACTENEVSGGYYVVYAAIPRPGWRFVRWEGPCSPKSDFQHCRLDVSEADVKQWDDVYPEVEIPPSVAVFQPITGETGYLIGPGSVVAGVAYTTPTQQGVTGRDGSFQYAEGETVQFWIGDTLLGEVEGQPQVTPFNLAGSAILTGTPDIKSALDNEHDPFHTVINIAILLQTLDHDAKPDNGIMVRQSVAALLDGVSLDLGQHWQAFSKDFEFRYAVRKANAKRLFGRRHGVVKPAASLERLYKTLEIDPLITGVSLTQSTYGDGRWQYDDRGNVIRYEGAVFDPGGSFGEAVFIFRYDSTGNLLERTGSAAAYTLFDTRFRYDAFGNMIQHGQLLFEYDNKDRLIRETRDQDNDGLPDQENVIAAYQYNDQGLLTYSERGFDENGEPQQKYRYEYNDRGNLTLEEHVVSYNYDGSLKRYEYNSEDKLTRIFYGQATFATYEYDHLGNLTRHDEGGGGVRRKLKHYEYDDQGQLVRYEEYLDEDADPQRDPFNTRLFEYDDRGNLTRYLSTGFPKRNIRYEYDERGNIIRQVAGMYHRSWQYDENSNPVEVIMNRIPIELPYGYGDRIGTYVYDTYGKLIEEKSVFFNEGGPQTETSIYEYDDRGVMTRRTNVRVRGDSDLSYEYTGWGHIFFNPLDDDFGFELPLIFPSYPETPHPVLPIPIIPPDPLKQIRFP